MQQVTILSFLEAKLKDHYFHCPWRLKWREDIPYAELVFQHHLAVSKEYQVIDYLNQAIETDHILYEVKVLFCDRHQMEVTSPTYLKTISIDAQKGIFVGELLAIIIYLKELMTNLRVKWYEHLRESKQALFQVEWQEPRFEEIKQSLLDTNQYAQKRLFFPDVS